MSRHPRTPAASTLTAIFAAIASLLALDQSAAMAQPIGLNENCIVSVLNRNTRVKPDGSWVLPNIPANFGLVRARATCIFNGLTVSGESAPFLVLANGSVNVPPIVLGPTTAIPRALSLGAPTTRLTEIGATSQVSVRAVYSDGTEQDVTSGLTGTRYVISNPQLATITADGLVTGLASGTVLVQATHEGTSGLLSFQIVLSADSDGDGLPDDVELALGLDPNNAADALADTDRDGLTAAQEFALGTAIDDPDTDDDSLLDGEEATLGADGFVTSPLLADTDGDGIRDGLEVATGSDPTDPTSFNLALALLALTVAPDSFTLTVNSVQGTASVQLVVRGHLSDGTQIDLTSTNRGTNYASSDLNVCNFGAPDGRVFGAQPGSCTITVSNAGFAALVEGSVASFSPISLSSIPIPGYANNVDANGGFAYVAAGSAGLQVVSVSNPSAPVIVAALDTPGNANDVKIVGTLAYVADGSSGLRIIDVSNPAAPALVGSVDTTGDASDVVVAGTRAYIADGVTGLQIIDVQNPAAPVVLKTVDTAGTARGVDVEGTIAVVADDNGLRIVNVADPATAAIVGTLPLAGQIIDVDLDNGLAIVAAYTGGMHVVDVTVPNLPVRLGGLPGSAPNGFVPRDVQVAGEFALFAEQLFANAVAPIVSLESPANPVLRGVVDFGLDYAGTGIAISGPHVFWTGQSFVVGSENGVTGTTRLFIGQYISLEDRGGIPPAVTITQPADGSAAIEGSTVTVRATATDDIAVASVRFTRDGVTAFTDTSQPYEAQIALPTGVATVTIGAEASDLAGNLGTATPITLSLVPDPGTTIVGRVVDRFGVGIGGATVSYGALTDISGADGAFTIPGAPTVQGSIIVQATAVIEGVTRTARSAPAPAVPGGVTAVGDIRLGVGRRVALIHCDSTFNIRAALINSGVFQAEDIADISGCGAPPTLDALSEFGAALVWSNSPFGQRDALGNVLADFVDQGGGVVLATYAFSEPWRIGGRIVTAGYSPFEPSNARFTTSGRLDLANSNTNHPLLQGVGQQTTNYFTNANYTNPALTPGSNLVAVDTAGNRVVAVNATGRVVGISIFPGFALPPQIQRLFVNAVDFVR